MEIYANLVDTNYIPMSSPVSLDASDGTIRGNIFTAPDSGGLVTITGTASGRRGELTVNVVETPDELQIRQNNAAITTLSVQPGQQVNLDAVALYKHMTLATQDSDFTWSVTGNIGTIDADGVFTASNIPNASGSIVLSKGKATATVAVTMSQMPLETLEDFEDTTSFGGYGVTAGRDTATVRYGSASLKVAYTFPDATGAAVQLGMALPEGYDRLTFSVYGDGSGNTLSLYDNQGSTTPLVVLDFTGWKQVSVKLPAGCTTLSAMTITGPTAAGTIYLDQFVASYSDIVDNTAPVIQGGTLSGAALTATVTDAVDGALGKDSISLTCDGTAVDFQVSAGALTADLTAVLSDGKAHLVALTAWDASGNRVRQVWDVAATTAAASPFVDNVNADGTPHWAATYLDRLYEMGVLTGEEENGQRYVRPNRNMTRMEFAVMVFRYLGLSAADYENVQLPFQDNGKIQSWALTAVKAMYSLGIMTGNQEANGLYFDPSGTITRAQVITMLGRLQEKGYASNDLSAFSDSKDVPSWALSYVQTMVAQGILTGSDGKLTPNAAMTRAEACKLLYMMQ